MDYTVRIAISVTADNPDQAAALALAELRDTSVGPRHLEVSDLHGNTANVTVHEGEEFEDIGD